MHGTRRPSRRPPRACSTGAVTSSLFLNAMLRETKLSARTVKRMHVSVNNLVDASVPSLLDAAGDRVPSDVGVVVEANLPRPAALRNLALGDLCSASPYTHTHCQRKSLMRNIL
jgi:hypothetical protein